LEQVVYVLETKPKRSEGKAWSGSFVTRFGPLNKAKRSEDRDSSKSFV
jgi:hypothetical protein